MTRKTPQHLLGVAQPGAQFVQLEVRELQMAEAVLVQGVCVLTSTEQPGHDRGVSKAEDPSGFGWVEPFGQRREHHGDLVWWGFQTGQGRVAPGSERAATGLASKCLNVLNTAMFAIALKTRGLEREFSQSTGTAGWDRRSLRCLSEWRAPRRLFTSQQGRTGAGAAPPPVKEVKPRRQAEQSSGVRGFRRWWSVVRLVPPREEEDRRWNQSKRQSTVRKRRRQTTSRNTNTGKAIRILAA